MRLNPASPPNCAFAKPALLPNVLMRRARPSFETTLKQANGACIARPILRLLLTGLLVASTFGLPALLHGAVGDILLTFNNPSPERDERFGTSVSAFGNLIAVGAPRANDRAAGAGAVYLFDRTGTLQQSVYSPTSNAGDWFGQSLTSVGSSYLLAGAIRDDTWANDAGAAYLYNAQGETLATYFSSNPSALASFGSSIASGGNDVLVGSYRERVGAVTDVGVAYRFSPQGTLLNKLNSPRPETSALFGWSVARGGDRIYVGATGDSSTGLRSGAVYVYNLAGELVQSIQNPTPAVDDSFGTSIAMIGDHVAISSLLDDTRGLNTGAVYVFDRDGALVDTIFNPRGNSNEQFGASLAVTPGGLAVGAPGYKNFGFSVGAVDLFDFNGDFKKTVANPGIGLNEQFGQTIAAMGNDLLIGHPASSNGAPTAGRAYLVEGLPPALAGDVNQDFRVDLTDYILFRNFFGKAGGASDGDLNGDGKVDVSDFVILRRNFGKSALTAPVPEPAFSTVGAVALGFACWRALLNRKSRT